MKPSRLFDLVSYQISQFDKKIALAKKENGKVYITNAGWFSDTTKERLNGIQGVSIHQKDYVWYLNGKEWNGKLTEI